MTYRVSPLRYIKTLRDLILLRKRQERGRQEMMSNSVFILTGCFPSVARPAGTSRRFDTNKDTHTHTHVCEAWRYTRVVFLICFYIHKYMLLYTVTHIYRGFTYVNECDSV